MLSLDARKEIGRLSGARPRRFILEIAKTWLIVFAAVAIAVHLHSFFVSCLAILIVAGRQNALGLLMHDQAHYLGFKSRWGDLITDLLVCYPLLIVSVKSYARVHLTHHKFYFTDKDPDLIRKSGKDWLFPMNRSSLCLLLLKDMLGLTIIQNIIGKNKKDGVLDMKRRGPSHAWLKLIYLSLGAAFFTYTHTWIIFLIYWLLPLSTIMQAFIRLGAICEHVYIPHAPYDISTAIIVPTWWEGLVFPHLNFFYHIYHHYFPGVSFSYLPAVHKIFIDEGLVREYRIFKGILKYLGFLTSSYRNLPQEMPI